MILSRSLLCVAGLGPVAGCQVRDDDPYAVQQRELAARVDRLDQLFKNQSLQGLSQRIDGDAGTGGEAAGEVEVLEHDEDLDKKQQRDLYQDLDKRLQKLERASCRPATARRSTGQAPPAIRPATGGGSTTLPIRRTSTC